MNQNATTSPEVDRSRTSPWKSSVLDTSFSHTSRDSLAVRFPEAQNRKRMEGGLRCTQLEIVKSKIELEPVARQSPYSPANGIGQARGGGGGGGGAIETAPLPAVECTGCISIAF